MPALIPCAVLPLSRGGSQRAFSSGRRRLVRAALCRADGGAGARLAGDQGRAPCADRRAHRIGQDAGRLPGGDRRAGAAGRRERPRRRDADRLCLAAQGALERHPQESRGAACRHPRGAARARACPRSRSARWVRTGDTPPGERDRMRRKPPHIVVTTPESLYILLGSEVGPRHARDHAHRDRRRDPCARAQQARRASGAVARAARRALPAAPCCASASRRPRSRSRTSRTSSSASAARPSGCRVIIDTGHRRARDLALEVPPRRSKR